jgi:peptide/nickel transport system permease protein
VLRFLIRRGISALGLLLVVSMVTFVLIKAPHGDYAEYAASQARSQGGLSYEDSLILRDQIRKDLGLDRPLAYQYLNWITGMVLQGDFGKSFVYNKPVSTLLAERFWRTLVIASTCHLLATFIGVGLGIVGAVYQHRLGDRIASTIAFLGMTIPRFFMALVILYWLAFVIGYPYIGAISSREYIFAPMSFAKLWDTLKHVWPIIFVAAFGGLAYNMRVMRGNLLDVLRQPYIEAARAKGLPGRTVVLKHAVPNALHPLIMYQGIAMPYMLSGELEVAIVLGIPTIGPLMLDSLYRNDIWVTATIFLWLSAVLVVANLVADIALGLIDPRVRQAGAI